MKPVSNLQKEIKFCRKAAAPSHGTAAFLCSTGIAIIQEKSTFYFASDPAPPSHNPSKKASPPKRQAMEMPAKNAGI